MAFANIKTLKIICLLLLVAFFSGCARQGTPTGGAIDTIPPVVINTIPEINRVNFSGKKIRLSFDEFIRVNNIKGEFYTSPPMKFDPLIYPRGVTSKSLAITIKDTLKENTTYKICFGNSIVDNHEGNVLEGYEYRFSTGKKIDTFGLKGTLSSATNEEIPKNLTLALFQPQQSLTDSLVAVSDASYITKKIDSMGVYEFSHLKEGAYQLIAIENKYYSKLFSPKKDVIGFVTQPVDISQLASQALKIYQQKTPFRVLTTKELNKGHFAFTYEGNAQGVAVELLTNENPSFDSQVVIDELKKEIHYWFQPVDQKSINLKITNNTYSKTIEKKLRSKEFFKLDILSGNDELQPDEVFYITSNTPIVKFDKLNIQVLDSVQEIDVKPYLSGNRMKLLLYFERKYAQEYNIKLLPNAIKDLFGQQNDSISYAVTFKNPKDFGTILVDFEGNYQQGLILGLLDESGVLIAEKAMNTPKATKFEFLAAGTYALKVTYDSNNNGRFDTGNFMEKKLPERIDIYNEELNVEENEQLQKTIILTTE